MVCSFLLNAHFTYRTRPTWRKFLLFPLTQATNYGVQSVGLVALVSWLGVSRTVAPLAAAGCALPFTYLVSRRVLLPRRRKDRARLRPIRRPPPVRRAGLSPPAPEGRACPAPSDGSCRAGRRCRATTTTARPPTPRTAPGAAECATWPRCQGLGASWAIAIRSAPSSSRAAITIRPPPPIGAAATRP